MPRIIVPAFFLLALFAQEAAAAPVKVIFDTDVGNDIDDALALSVLHSLADRGEAEILSVTITKDNPLCAPFVDAVNTFHGRPDIPIGVVKGGKTPEDGNFLRPIVEAKLENGDPAFPHDLKSGADVPEATGLLRKILAAQPDGGVVFVTVGFLTNAARLLDSPPDEHSPLAGPELIKAKIKTYVAMAGAFSAKRAPEYNLFIDADASRRVFEAWPGPIVASGFEIGLAIQYTARSIEKDFAWTPRHPVAEAYRLYMKFPYDRPTWDLTAVLWAVRPEHGYFGLSHAGRISLGEKNVTLFGESGNGPHRFLTASPAQAAGVLATLESLASAPPGRR